MQPNNALEKDNVDAASIESIVGTQDQQNNLLFYNFNAYEVNNVERKRHADKSVNPSDSKNGRILISQSSKRSLSRASIENSRQL